jgi:pimeloyl-ACP methyl ester carboxylesterase
MPSILSNQDLEMNAEHSRQQSSGRGVFPLISVWLSIALLLFQTGCTTPIGADKVSPRQAYQHLHQNALNSSQCSAETLRVLRRYNLEDAFRKQPDATLETLQAIACIDDRRDLLYALSELNYLNADRQSRSVRLGVPKRARNSYFASAIYAYLYLFGGGREVPLSPFDIRFRAAGDFYNRGLAQGLMAGTNALVEMASGPRQTPPGVVTVQFTQPGFPWSLDLIKEFYSADEFIVRGMSTRNRESGLGTPLIAVTKNVGKFQEQLRAPATAFLRVSGNVRDWSAGKLGATLELYAAFDAAQVEVNGKPVPLQTDTTAPIAQGLNDSPVWKLGLAQFFSADLQSKTGIRRMEPYSPGQIPVVFVHGTASSPVWWAEMWNTLNADPVLRERYQFWMFNYASGNPITYTAGILRNDLMDEIKTLDPDGKDAALQHMVVIGHSQGGLLAKLAATDTGDKVWQLVSKTNIDELNIDPQTRGLLQSNFFFKPLPCVSRVIFIATPHRGSYQNTSFVQNLLSRFMKFPSEIVDASASLLKLQNTVQLPASVRRGVPSSLNGMATNNPFMLTLADIPVAPGIKANSIIAIKGKDEPPKGADGVVKYTSAHVDYAESEFIVRSGHSCQGNPLTIEEVRRILHEHLASLPASLTNASPPPPEPLHP